MIPKFRYDAIKEIENETEFTKIVIVAKEVHFYYKDGTKKKAINAETFCFSATVEDGKVQFNRKLKFINE